MLLFNVWSFLEWYLRPFIKWFLRKTTRLCELQRICYGERPGAARSIAVEKSLMLSRTRQIKEIVTFLNTVIIEKRFVSSNFDIILDPAINIILRVKKINPKLHSQFAISFRSCLEQIWCYKQLLNDVEELRKKQYDNHNLEHENKLLQLWSLLMPYEPLKGRITKQWQDIGFQVSL